MMSKGKMIAAGAALLALSAGSAQAATSCWSQVEQAAAKVRSLQALLVDATLKCQLVGSDITEAYNGFVRSNRATLQGANSVLRARLGEREFDRFVTFLANDMGKGATDANSCAQAALAAETGIAVAGSIPQLMALADILGAEAELPGGACEIVFALASAE